MSENIFLSEIITDTDIETWYLQDVLISADTGYGKTHFIKTKLYKYAKKRKQKILLLLPRKSLKNQNIKQIKKEGKLDVISITGYHVIENIVKHGGSLKGYFEKFDFVVCDEFHYFISDASFNKDTVKSLQAIIQANTSKIWISATSEKVVKFFHQYTDVKFIEYKFPSKDKDIKLVTYKNESELDQIVDITITEGKKAILFTNDLHYGVKVYERYSRYATFNCSESNYYFYKFVDEHEINQIEESESFKKNILVTSTAFDSGLNICDKTVDRIILHNIHEIDTIIQCIGRKRFEIGDRLTIYIPELKNQAIGAYIAGTKKALARANFLKFHTETQLIRETEMNPRKYAKIERIVFDTIQNGTVKKTINEAAYFHFAELAAEYSQMIKLGCNGFRKFVMQKLGIKSYSCFNGTGHRDLACYLESLVIDGQVKKADKNKIMKSKADKDKFIDRIKMLHKDDYLRDLTVINQIFASLGLMYKVEAYATSIMVDGRKKSVKAWKVVRA